MATAYENATAEKQRLEIQKKQIDGRLAEIETFLRLHQQFESSSPDAVGFPVLAAIALASSAPSKPMDESSNVSPPSRPKPKGVSQKQFNEHLLALLADIGRPLKFDEIKTKLADRNVPIGGQNESKNLSSKLWAAVKNGGFTLGSNGYWIDNLVPTSNSGSEPDPTDPFGPPDRLY
jgi:hypothetical protein